MASVSMPVPMRSAPMMASRTSYSAAPAKSVSVPMAGREVGFSVGGAKDTNTFRENLKKKKLPLPSDITYEGLFYEYYFNQNPRIGAEPCTKLFCPSFAVGISPDPLKKDPQHPDIYLAVGLDSGIKNWERKPLNLVVVLDISGSMGSSFDTYYYDSTGQRRDLQSEPLNANADWSKTKMAIAREVVASMIANNLRDDDYVGMVLFDDAGYVAHQITSVCDLDLDYFVSETLQIEARGGTNFEAGYKTAVDILQAHNERNKDANYHNRIIFLTDAQPNSGDTSKDGLVGMAKIAAENDIYTSFIGIGLDFNTELIEHFSKIHGSNYYSTMSSTQMAKTLDEEFDFFVSPMVFDLELSVRSESDAYSIAKVYGSPQADEATGKVMYINTLFPSAKTAEGVKGGVILIQLKPNLNSTNVTGSLGKVFLTTTYKDAAGQAAGDKRELALPDVKRLKNLAKKASFDNSGTRKAVFLTRYANVIKNWLADQRKIKARTRLLNQGKRAVAEREGLLKFQLVCGVRDPIPIPSSIERVSQWERMPAKLRVHKRYKQVFKKLLEHAKREFKVLDDDSLQQELDVLAQLSN